MTLHARNANVLDARAWWLLPALCTLALLWLLHPELLLKPGIPASYDMTGHLFPVAELRNRLLPQGRVHGWSADWFAGFPLFYFYFPLPALIACALSMLVSLEAALKVTAVLGLLLFPAALYALFRALATSRAHAALATTVAASFLLMQSFWYLGGNIASTLAGEFAFSFSLTLSLGYLATLLRGPRGMRGLALAAVLLAGVALSHLVTTITVVLVSAVLLADAGRRRAVLGSWILALLLSAFWTLPFLLRHGELAEVYAHAARALTEVLPLELWAVVPGAVAAAAAVRRDARVQPLLVIAAAGILLYLIAGRFVYPGRFLPYFFLGLHMLAGYAIAGFLLRRTKRDVAIGLLLLLPIAALHGWRGSGYLRQWSLTTFAGLQARGSWTELHTLAGQLDPESGGVYWEQAPAQLAALGSRNLAAVTPYLVPGQRVLNGLWLESSQLHGELVAIDSAVARAPRAAAPEQAMREVMARLGQLGVSQFVALNFQTADLLARAGARPVHASPRLVLFRMDAAPRVEVVGRPELAVQLLEWSDQRVRFRTGAVDVPHRVRMSFFPNWRARGATIQRDEKSMLIVTPTQRNVELVFASTWVERAGAIISVLTAAGLMAAVLFLSARASGRAQSHPADV